MKKEIEDEYRLAGELNNEQLLPHASLFGVWGAVRFKSLVPNLKGDHLARLNVLPLQATFPLK